MTLHVSLDGPGDIGARIHRQILDAVLTGLLRPGERVPPSRELARTLQVSRTTVATVYERLTAEGVLVGKVGAGTFVGTVPLNRTAPLNRTGPDPRQRTACSTTELVPRGAWASLGSDLEPLGGGALAGPSAPPFDFRVGAPDPALFPLPVWRRLVARELRAELATSADYAEPAGHAGLRAAIARHFGIARSLWAAPDDVIVTQGAQQALDLAARVLIEPGTLVAVEDPGYPPARQLFTALGAEVVGVPVDDEGIDVTALPRGAALVYTTPSHQFPLGVPMSLARRAALLRWADEHGAAIVEDDYDSEFRFCDRPLEPLQSLDRDGRVIYVGTFSKTLLPLLRIGFLVAPRSLQPALRAAKRLTDWHGVLPEQAALGSFIDEGLLARHIRAAGRVYEARHDELSDAVATQLGRWLEPVPSAAGLHLATRARPGMSVEKIDRVVRRARQSGVAIDPLARYAATPATAQAGVVFGFGAIQADKIATGVELLADCFPA
ncbi:MocR-like pyridoxine biosynthesis transcription factor PdxR [Pseudonocardia sp. TRM90224]|uniref:MocR-like pyridoxine biosynthesis transcription factor PdxR n=1 Tax=Pseudonocardia sp. TRM90224 TaxID=2812678 RepID=UPI001E62B7B0|nr:PLP-dependent aminotransferase family protein [Pseudonocardia sp. TRM90224]